MLPAIPGDSNPRRPKGTVGSDSYLGFRAGGAFFHDLPQLTHFQPRDLAGSKALRRIDAAHAEALIEAAHARSFSAQSHRAFQPQPEVLKAIEEQLPAVSDPRLKKAIAGVLGAVAGQQLRLQKILEDLPAAPQRPNQASSTGAFRLPERQKWEEELQAPLSGLVTLQKANNTLFSEIDEVASFFSRPDPQAERLTFTPRSGTWEPLIGNTAALAYRMLLPKLPAADRTTLRRLLEKFIQIGFSGEGVPSRLRLGLVDAKAWPSTVEHEKPELSSDGANDFLCWPSSEGYVVLERARGGSFQHVHEEGDVLGSSGWGSAEQLDELWRCLEERGPIALKEAISHFAAQRGLPPSEATLYATAEWDTDGYGWVKAREFDWARHTFGRPYGWDVDVPRLQFVAAVVESGPLDELWDAERLAQRLSAHFLRDNPKPVVIADESLITELATTTSSSQVLAVVRQISAPGGAASGKSQRRFFAGSHFRIEGPSPSYPGAFVPVLLYGFYQAKVGDPFFRNTAAAWQALRQWLLAASECL